MEQRVSLITLGVTDLERATAFYEMLGWKRVESPDGIVVFDLIGQVLGLYPLPKLAEEVRATAMGLLAHLSLLFVPAGVGIVGHVTRLGHELAPILAVIVFSTVLSLIVAVYTFVLVSRWVGDDG